MKNLSPKTAESYEVAKLWLVRRFGDIDISTITYKQITDWYEWLCGWQSKDTARNNIICVRMVLKHLKYMGESVINFEEIPVPKREKRRIKFLTEAEIEEFIEEVGKPRRGYSKINAVRNVALLRFMASTGLRNTEICAMNRDTIQERTFTVVGKSKHPHISFIDSKTEQALREYLDTRTDSNNALFISHINGKRINSAQLRNLFATICQRSEKFKGIHPHTIRHSYGTKMLSKGVDLRYIGDLMGHEDLNTTRLYTHYANPKLKQIYDNAHGLLT